MTIQESNIREAIQDIWKKRESPLTGKSDYPASISAFVFAEIDGEVKMFRVSVKEFMPPTVWDSVKPSLQIAKHAEIKPC